MSYRPDRSLDDALDAKAAPGMPRHLAWLGALLLAAGLVIAWLWTR